MHWICAGSKRLAFLSAVGSSAGLLAVYHVGRDCQCRQCVLRSSVSRSLLQLVAELRQYLYCDRVYSVVDVAVFGEIALDIKINDKTVVAIDWRNFRILDCRERVCDNRQARYAASHKSRDLGVVQSHLYFLIRILVVHSVDYVEGVDIEFAHPRTVLVKRLHYFVVVEFTLELLALGSNLHTEILILTAVERQEK